MPVAEREAVAESEEVSGRRALRAAVLRLAVRRLMPLRGERMSNPSLFWGRESPLFEG